MKLRMLAALVVAGGLLLTMRSLPAQACNGSLTPCNAQDHTWNVTLSNYAAGSNPNATIALTLGTTTTANVPVAPFPVAFFDEATTTYGGLIPGTSAVANTGALAGTITFDIQSNLLLPPNNIKPSGQAPLCGETGTQHLGPFNNVKILTAVKNTTDAEAINGVGLGVVSWGPSPTPTFNADQLLDNPHGGLPMGVTHVPNWYAVLPSLGLVESVISGRGYAVTATTPASHTTVTFLTIGLGSQTIAVTVLGDPTAGFSPTGQVITTCPPFSSTVNTLGVSTAQTLNCTGVDYYGNPFLPACTAAPSLGASAVALTMPASGTFDYRIALSSGANLTGVRTTAAPPNDMDIFNTWNNCRLNPDPSQADANSNGIGNVCKGGGAWINPSTSLAITPYNANASAITNASLSCTGVDSPPHSLPSPTKVEPSPPFAACQDADQDGALNFVDNCPLTQNTDIPPVSPAIPNYPANVTPGDNQKDTVRDGVGDACRPNADIAGTGAGYPTYVDYDDFCNQPFTVGGASGASVCYSATGSFRDSNDNRTPDFAAANAAAGVPYCMQDHQADSNHDGYTDSDQGSPSPLPVCPANPVVTDMPYPASGGLVGGNALAACPGRFNGTGATAAQIIGAKKAKADANLDGKVNVLDLSAAAAFYNQSGFALDAMDKRNEFDMNGDGKVNVLDLSAMAAFYNQTVPAC